MQWAVRKVGMRCKQGRLLALFCRRVASSDSVGSVNVVPKPSDIVRAGLAEPFSGHKEEFSLRSARPRGSRTVPRGSVPALAPDPAAGQTGEGARADIRQRRASPCR